jgi:putative ABC transport system permease protein
MMGQCIRSALKAMVRIPSRPRKPLARPHPPVLFPLVSEAWVSIGTNRIRALLAMLGIIIGVASVVLMVAIGTGSQRKIEKAINSLGNNLLLIVPSFSQPRGVSSFPEAATFTENDLNAVSQIEAVEAVAYASGQTSQEIGSTSGNSTSSVTGTIPEYFPIRNWSFEDGDSFTDKDIRLNHRVAVIGATVAAKLFPDRNPLGQTLSLGEKKVGFLIVGVLERKGAGLDGRDQDDVVFVPSTTYKSYLAPYFPSVIQTIYAKVASDRSMEEASEDIEMALRKTQKLKAATSNNFTIYNLVLVTKVASDSTAAFSLLLGSIAAISLLVGSIGIMNIMLVTVSERTREIGVRKAIGATGRQIMIQFILEAVMISVVGSVVGLAVGLGGGWSAHHWLNIPVAFSWWSILMALLMAGGIGIASGLYPAYKAVRLQPIEALRAVGA